MGPANNDATSDCAGVAWLSVTNGSSAQLALLVCRPHKQNLMKRGHAASFVTRMPLLEIRLTFDVFHGCRFNHWGQRHLCSTMRPDAWWLELVPVIGLRGGFEFYATLRAFEGNYYERGPSESKVPSPCLSKPFMVSPC